LQANFDPWVSEWSNPVRVMPHHPALNPIGAGGDTGGSETSQYPEEKKSREIPQVVASERGGAQTAGLARRGCGTA